MPGVMLPGLDMNLILELVPLMGIALAKIASARGEGVAGVLPNCVNANNVTPAAAFVKVRALALPVSAVEFAELNLM